MYLTRLYIGYPGRHLQWGVRWTCEPGQDQNNEMARVDDCAVSDWIDNFAFDIGHGNSECHLFQPMRHRRRQESGAIQLHGGSVQMVNCFFDGPGWLLDFQPGPYYHQSFVANTDAERGGGWFRSADGCKRSAGPVRRQILSRGWGGKSPLHRVERARFDAQLRQLPHGPVGPGRLCPTSAQRLA